MPNQRRTAQPPAMPPQAAGDDSLFSQIAAGDEIGIVKHRNSWLMSMMVSYMRLTLAIDAKRREYQNVFRVMGLIWSVFMSTLYLCGIVMFAILVGSYIRFPDYVKNYLAENGILYEDIKIPGYVVSQVELYGLHNKDNSYRIDHVSVSSTFADFLNRRAKNVSLKGVKLNVESGHQSAGFLAAINRLNTVAQSGGGIRIDTLEVSDATVTVMGNGYKIPVSVSLTGVYGRETNISAFISVDEPYMNIRGPLSIRDAGQGITWDLDIQSGSVVLPGRPREGLSGKVSVTTKDTQVLSASANLVLLYDRLQKDLTVSLENEKGEYKGTVGMKWTDVASAANPTERTAIEFGLSGLTFSDTMAQTDKPISVKLSTSYATDIQAKGVNGTLTGTLKCYLFDRCTYDLTKKSVLNAQWLRLPILGSKLDSSKSVRLTLDPTSDMMELALKDGFFKFNMAAQNFVVKGIQFETNGNASLSASQVRVNGQLNLWTKNMVAALSAENVDYETQTHEIKKATVMMDDVFHGTGRVYFKSPRVVLNDNKYLKVPFALDYARQNDLSQAIFELQKDNLRIMFSGYFDKTNGVVDGQFVIPPVDLKKVPQPLSRISGLLPDVKTTSGSAAAYGRLTGNLDTKVSGPVYLALSDVDFTSDNLKVNRLNTALTLQSVIPFVSEPMQRIYIGHIESFIPIKDVDMTLRLDNQFAQLNQLSAQMAGILLEAEPTVVPYKNVGTLLYLKNRDLDLTGLDKAVTIKNWVLDGALRGSILIPVEVKDLELSIRNIALQVSDATLTYTGDAAKKPAFLEKEKKVSVLSGSISVDKEKETVDKVKANFVMDVFIGEGNQRVKKIVRDTFNGALSSILTFSRGKNTPVPTDIKDRIAQIIDQVRAVQF